MKIQKPQRLFKKPEKSMLTKIITFFKEARIEMKKVNWPTKKQTINYTLLVIGLSLVVAAFLGGLDYLFGYLLRTFII